MMARRSLVKLMVLGFGRDFAVMDAGGGGGGGSKGGLL